MKLFQEQYRAVDQHSGAGVADLPYRVVLADGSVVSGRTDERGRTQKISTTDPQALKLFWDSVDEIATADSSNGVEGC